MNKAEHDIYNELITYVRTCGNVEKLVLVRVKEIEQEVFGKKHYAVRYYFRLYHGVQGKPNPYPIITATKELVEQVDLKTLSEEIGVQIYDAVQ